MSMENAERHYRGEAGERYRGRKRGIPEAAMGWVARTRAEKLSGHIGEADTVMEYGAGFGWNLAGLKGKRKLAFDLEDHLSPSIRAGGVEFVAETKSMAGGTIDVMICHHTLEHVTHPAMVLAEMARLLRAGGKLLLFVPDERERRFRKFARGEPNHHLYAWNAQTLGNLTEECGFRVTEATTGEFGYDRFAAVWAAQLHVGERGFRALRRVLQIVKPAREVRLVAVKAG